MCNLHWCYTFCTDVTLFALVLHFLHWCYTWTALLLANQHRVIFSCVLLCTVEVELCKKQEIKRLPVIDPCKVLQFAIFPISVSRWHFQFFEPRLPSTSGKSETAELYRWYRVFTIDPDSKSWHKIFTRELSLVVLVSLSRSIIHRFKTA